MKSWPWEQFVLHEYVMEKEAPGSIVALQPGRPWNTPEGTMVQHRWSNLHKMAKHQKHFTNAMEDMTNQVLRSNDALAWRPDLTPSTPVATTTSAAIGKEETMMSSSLLRGR